MEFSSWYVKSIAEAQARYKKEDEDKIKAENRKKAAEYQVESYNKDYGSIDMNDDDGEEEWYGI